MRAKTLQISHPFWGYKYLLVHMQQKQTIYQK